MKPLIIQIGSNIGLDHVFDFLTNTDTQYNVYLIEPNIYSLKKCEENYKPLLKKHNISFINAAVCPDENTEIVLYFPKEDTQSPFASFSKDFVIKHIGHSNVEEMRVKGISINQLLNTYSSNNKIEYLYIDTEGLCIDIVNSIDFDTFDIKNLIFEYIHSDGILSFGGEKLQVLLQKLSELGYKTKKEGYDTLATKI